MKQRHLCPSAAVGRLSLFNGTTYCDSGTQGRRSRGDLQELNMQSAPKHSWSFIIFDIHWQHHLNRYVLDICLNQSLYCIKAHVAKAFESSHPEGSINHPGKSKGTFFVCGGCSSLNQTAIGSNCFADILSSILLAKLFEDNHSTPLPSLETTSDSNMLYKQPGSQHLCDGIYFRINIHS